MPDCVREGNNAGVTTGRAKCEGVVVPASTPTPIPITTSTATMNMVMGW